MYHKIVSLEQISALKVGDIIKRYPQPGEPEDVFDEQKTRLIDTYVVKTIQTDRPILGLIDNSASLAFFPSPGSVGRLFIHREDLVKQQVWWLGNS